MATDPNKKYTILDIRKGSLLDYDLINWKAVGEYNYSWGDDNYSREFMLSGQGKTLFLEIDDEEEEMGVSVFRKISIHKIQQNFQNLHRQGKIPETLDYGGRTYRFQEENEGEWRDRAAGGNWEPFTVWDYADSRSEHLLSVEYWPEDNEWEAYAGKSIDASEITNITRPSKLNKSFNSFKKNIGWIFFIFVVGVQLSVCSFVSNRSSSKSIYTQSEKPSSEGLTDVIQQYREVPDFTVLLKDMTYENNVFKHQYQVLIPAQDSVRIEDTDWKLVSGNLFKQYQDYLGLEIAFKKDGAVSMLVAPPGYSDYVGDEQYGSWEEDENPSTRSNGMIWRFYPRYYYLRNTLYGGGYQPARYNNWNQYNSNIRGKANYQGPNNMYSTRNLLQTQRGRRSSWGRVLPSLQSRLQEEKTSRSGSRYSNSNSRSRSRSFGK